MRYSTRRISGTISILFVAFILVPAAPTLAQHLFWADPVAGTFQDGDSWDVGSPPDADSWVGFDVSGSYTVDFDGAATTSWLWVEDGAVTFDLGGNTYNAVGPGGFYHWFSGNSTQLSVINGSLRLTEESRIEDGATLAVSGATASLILAAGSPLNLASGTVSVTGGASFNADGGSGDISVGQGGGRGELVVSGMGSSFVSDFWRQSIFGSGTGSVGVLRVENGATATLYRHFYLGSTAGSAGEWTVTGSDSVLTVGAYGGTGLNLRVGAAAGASGSILVSNGGRFQAQSTSDFNHGFGGDASLTVTGDGSTAAFSRRVYLNRATATGSADMSILDGGSVTISRELFITVGGAANITISGENSLLNISNSYGTSTHNGTATILIEDGGRMTPGTFSIASTAAGSATVTVTGTQSQLAVGSSMPLGVGGNAGGTEWVGAAGGIGALNVRDGGLASTGGRLYVFPQGTLHVDGGRVEAGTLMLTDGSALEVVLRSSDKNDTLITVVGEVRLQNNTFDLDVEEDFVFSVGDVFRLVGFGSLNSDFNRFADLDDGSLISATGNPEYEFQLNYGTLAAHDGYVTLMAIPEPGTLTLLSLFGAIALLRVRRRA